MSKCNFIKTVREEQETIINIDYFEKIVILYTSRESVYKRLISRIGQPTKSYYTLDKKFITGVKWEIPFNDKKSTRIFSKTLIVGNM